MLYNYVFVFLGFLVDGVLNAVFPARFAFESMYFVPCVGLCAMVLTAKKMDKVDKYQVFCNYLKDEFPSEEKINQAIMEIEKIKAYFVQNKKTNTYPDSSRYTF